MLKKVIGEVGESILYAAIGTAIGVMVFSALSVISGV
jgi:hypothetical protein